jgi:hypothetical protein
VIRAWAPTRPAVSGLERDRDCLDLAGGDRRGTVTARIVSKPLAFPSLCVLPPMGSPLTEGRVVNGALLKSVERRSKYWPPAV